MVIQIHLKERVAYYWTSTNWWLQAGIISWAYPGGWKSCPAHDLTVRSLSSVHHTAATWDVILNPNYFFSGFGEVTPDERGQIRSRRTQRQNIKTWGNPSFFYFFTWKLWSDEKEFYVRIQNVHLCTRRSLMTNMLNKSLRSVKYKYT